MMGINGQPTTQLGALLAGQDPIRFGYGFVDGPNLLYELGILTFPGMATYGKPITKVNGAEDAELQAFFKELAKQPNSAAPGNPNPIDPVTGDYVMMNQGVVRVSKDYGPRELSLIDKAGLAVANFFILNDLNTIKDSNASIPEKGLAAASIIPIGRLLKLDELDFILKKESPAVGVISSGKGGKVADKGTGTNSKKANGAYKFNFVENAKKHLKNVENVNTKKGIVGGHNMDEFNKALKSQGFNPNDLIVSKKPHPSIEGIYEIEYKIPRKDMAGNIAEPVSYKNIKEPKTVYDPSKISDDKIYQWGQEAMQNGKINGRLVEGTASNGLKYRGYLNEAGEITNFFPIID